MTEEQTNWLNKVIALCQSGLNGTTPTYEDTVQNIQSALDTCPEP